MKVARDGFAVKVLAGGLLMPALMLLLAVCFPQATNWKQTFWCSLFGWMSWTCFSLAGLSGAMDAKWAIITIFEFAFGLVPMVYLLVDYPLAGPGESDCREQTYRARLFTTIPTVILTKQLGRWTVHEMGVQASTSTWWHNLVDLSEIAVFFCYGLFLSLDAGEVWFMVYSTIPIVWSFLVVDRMILRVQTLLRSNERLMQTVFTAVVRIDARNGKVLESSPAFDALVQNAVGTVQLETLFTASREQLRQLCSSGGTSEQIVRRLRTTLVSKAGGYHQDVELRVLAASEQEACCDDIHILSLGVSVMGERVPASEASKANTSLLLEQCFEEVGQVWAVGVTGNGRVPEHGTTMDALQAEQFESEVDPHDSVSQAGLRPRHGSKRWHSSCSHTISTSAASRSSTPPEGQASSQQPMRPYGDQWEKLDEKRAAYLRECCFAVLEDIISSWNYENQSCCCWHGALDRLSCMVEAMQLWHECDDGWPQMKAVAQCSNCYAIQVETDGQAPDACLICAHEICAHEMIPVD